MLFNSLAFALFLPVVFFVYWFALGKKLALQNGWLLIASYFFYGCWDWRFMLLLVFSTGLDYYSGLKIAQHKENISLKKFWLVLSVGLNLAFLGLFKYYNFFMDSFADLLNSLGAEVHFSTLNIILPVGISFYTFHGLSYVIDIYYDKIEPEKDAINYGLFVSFFPLLVAGPIERATHLLPQIKKNRIFEPSAAREGLRQILWGLFKKIVIADNCAGIVNEVFADPAAANSPTLAFAAILFAFQIYGDFSGYSDIALGTARLFGLRLLRNFAFPYFSRDMAEFWRRWHISLSSWFRDYLYIPLGGSRANLSVKIRNTFIIFLVSGFWHGANWTFIVWGLLNACYILPLLVFDRNRNHLKIAAEGRSLPSLGEVFNILLTFLLTCVAWIFFRADSLYAAWVYLRGIFIFQGRQIANFNSSLVGLIFFLIIIEWWGREGDFALEKIKNWRYKFARWGFYLLVGLLIFLYQGKSHEFIYFQF